MKRYLAAAAVTGALVASSGSAEAQSFIRQAGVHDSSIEVEVHGAISGVWWGAFATGPGFRIGIPLARNVGRINNMPAINFGADVMFMPWYWNYGGWGLYITSPVVLQWNFYVHHRWSIAPEAGFTLDFWPDVYGGRCGNWGWNWGGGCGFGIYPSLAFTARYHFRDQAGFPALVMRLGFPVGFNIGVSF